MELSPHGENSSNSGTVGVFFIDRGAFNGGSQSAKVSRSDGFWLGGPFKEATEQGPFRGGPDGPRRYVQGGMFKGGMFMRLSLRSLAASVALPVFVLVASPASGGIGPLRQRQREGSRAGGNLW